MPAPVVLILAAGRGERFLASGGNTHKCIGWSVPGGCALSLAI